MSGTTEQPTKPVMEPYRLWNVTDLSQASGKSKQWVRQLLREGEDLKGHKVGRDWVVLDEDAHDWLEDLMYSPQ